MISRDRLEIVRTATKNNDLNKIKELFSYDLRFLKEAFMDSCWRGNLDIVKFLSKKSTHDLLILGKLYACDNNKTETIKFLDTILSKENFDWKKEGF